MKAMKNELELHEELEELEHELQEELLEELLQVIEYEYRVTYTFQSLEMFVTNELNSLSVVGMSIPGKLGAPGKLSTLPAE